MAGSSQLLVGVSPGIAKLRAYLEKVAASDASVLITGETGTGKECVARYLHEHSRRADHPMECINCSALPDGLLESELFGHERGAFTGAHQAQIGRLRRASGGTLFLDEIGDMSQGAQAKILRAIESRGHPVVGRRVERFDANRRGDERRPTGCSWAMAAHDLSIDSTSWLHCRRATPATSFIYSNISCAPAVAGAGATAPEHARHRLMMRYDWPGNAREVRNLVDRLLIDLSLEDIPDDRPPARW